MPADSNLCISRGALRLSSRPDDVVGFDLMQDAERNEWMKWVTRYTLKHSTFFTSDAQITRDKAVAFGMNPDRTVVFPWVWI